ncbi:hypothetical protein ACH5RR_020759 [Cinchona calisaya]|uniref:Scarecrow-like protein 14 n=1 Tax=Cinchona calisaya TaxID=153742 RepID=A0ABD2ZIQ1_9GENT
MDHQFPKVNGSGIADNGVVLSSLEQSKFDIQFEGSWDSVNGFEFKDAVVFPRNHEQPSDPSSFAPFYNVSSEVAFPDENERYPVLNYINQILMEENVDEQPTMSHDPLALEAAVKSFYEIVAKNYPPSPRETLKTSLDGNAQFPNGYSGSSSKNGTESSDSSPNLDLYGKQYRALDNSFVSSFPTTCGDGQVGSLIDKNLISSFYSDSEAMVYFKKGLEEGNKFLPTRNQLVVNLDKYKLPSKLENVERVAKDKKGKEEKLANRLGGRKHQYQDDIDSFIGRNSKQSALCAEEVELSELFDRVLLYADSKGLEVCCDVDVEQPSGLSETLHKNQLVHGSDVGKSLGKKRATDTEALDLPAMLISCAQFVATDDHRAANEQLKVIRQHVSRTGNPHQRLAFILANALEARLAGTGHELHVALTSKQISAVEELKAYRVYLSAPLRQIFSFFANEMILKAASKATVLNIVDFGITFGFQWPSLIQQLSKRDGGPPKLRITGIEFPQPGLRPAERIDQTGHRLAKYCERFNVPFEYQAIATSNWEKIRIEELKLARNEVLAVVCQYGLKNILDETTVGDNCPRDAVLSLIRKMNPDILVNVVLSAKLSGPFFFTRFREALFHFSTIFDALDNNLPRKDEQRIKFEQEFLGTEMFNIVACEGLARVYRFETYKQWQARYERAGFRQLPLNPNLMKELRRKVKEGYHKDFMFDQDGCWMLQGWKGKILSACSCWVPC